MCEEININVNETNENINIVSTSIVDNIDINVDEITEDVTLNITEEVIQVNVNRIIGGLQSIVAGDNITVDDTDPFNPIVSSTASPQSLQDVTDVGNSTTNDIQFGSGAGIIFDNGSKVKEGTTNSNLGGNKGVALKCSIDYELKWEAGRLYTMEQNGFTIREVSHNFTNIPTINDDETQGFVIDSRWILDNGDVYVCTDATTSNAVWELQPSGGVQSVTGNNVDNTDPFNPIINTPTLQQVTDEGSITTNSITVGNLTNDFSEISASAVGTQNSNTGTYAYLGSNGLLGLYNGDVESNLKNTDVTNSGVILEFPDKATGSYFIATTDDLSGYVPYTGATQNVDLGEFELKAGQITLDTTPSGTASVTTTRWNDSTGVSETTLKGGNVILKNGIDLVARVVNKVNPNTTLTKAQYQVVRISGAQGQRLAVSLAQANNDNNSADTLGIVIETIATNQEGFIMTVGQLEGINTTGSLQGETWSDGDVLYLSPTTAGRITNIKPTGATGHIVVLGYVEHAHITQGKIYVKIMNGWELDELHNVYIDTPLNNQGLVYETSTSLWKNKTIDKSFVGLGNVDNTSDANKPISTATQTALNGKQNASTRRNANNTTNNNINYCGVALGTGVSESSAVWTITRLTITSAGGVTTAVATNVKWTDRETATYI